MGGAGVGDGCPQSLLAGAGELAPTSPAAPRGDQKLAGEGVVHVRAAAALRRDVWGGGSSRKQMHPLEVISGAGTHSASAPACLLLVQTPEKPGARGLAMAQKLGGGAVAAAELDPPPTILSTRVPSSTTAQASSPGRKGTPVLHSHLEHHLSAPWAPFLRGERSR